MYPAEFLYTHANVKNCISRFMFKPIIQTNLNKYLLWCVLAIKYAYELIKGYLFRNNISSHTRITLGNEGGSMSELD